WVPLVDRWGGQSEIKRRCGGQRKTDRRTVRRELLQYTATSDVENASANVRLDRCGSCPFDAAKRISDVADARWIEFRCRCAGRQRRQIGIASNHPHKLARVERRLPKLIAQRPEILE